MILTVCQLDQQLHTFGFKVRMALWDKAKVSLAG